jgi:leader peptidase (prepilin peptidase) / N-methyltransferase
VTAALSAYLFFTMALITVVDARHFIIPDLLSLPAIPIGVAASAMVVPDGDWLAGVTSGLAGALIGGGAFYLLRATYFRVRHIEGLGLGDVKLAAVAGAWLGPAALAPACLAATLTAIAALLLNAAISGRARCTPAAPFPSAPSSRRRYWSSGCSGFSALNHYGECRHLCVKRFLTKSANSCSR